MNPRCTDADWTWFAGCLVGWLIGPLLGLVVGRMVDWFGGLVVGWLIGGLVIDWRLVDSLAQYQGKVCLV